MFISGLAIGIGGLGIYNGLKKKSVMLSGDAEDVVDFFLDNGFTLEQSIGIAGNLQEESQFKTTALGDSGTAFGLAQWRGSRRENLEAFARDKNKDIRDFYLQLEFILHEFQTDEKRAFQKLLASNDLETATLNFAKYYERPQASTYPKRVMYANQIYNNLSL